MHRVAAIALRIPVAGDMRLRGAAVDRCRAHPDLVIAVARHFHGRGPALPVIARCAACRDWRAVQVAPKSVETSTCLTVLSPAQAAPRSLTSRVPAGSVEPLAGTGDDRAHRHRFQIPEVLFVRLVARHHRLDGDAIGRAAHALPSCTLSRIQMRVEPFRRHRSGPARNDQPDRRAMDIRSRACRSSPRR